MTSNARLGIDIGGTFTDLVLEVGRQHFSHKLLTTPRAPERAVISGVRRILSEAGIEPDALSLIIHGTTLATNAIIERKGARTALLVTEGFRDSVEMAYENRFEQYDLEIERPKPLVPRYLRWPVSERMGPAGQIWTALDEAGVRGLLPKLKEEKIESVAIGFLHAYANSANECRAAEIISATRPDLSISLSSEVCPEVREYERLSTTCANAYVQPLMSRYLLELEAELINIGIACPLLLMMSSGGLTTLATGIKFPIRLIDSGPAGGAILACDIAAVCGAHNALSFDMGGTTAKICLIDNGVAQTSRNFEVARAYRHSRGSGLPIRIPAVEMVEIGAGGGSIATVDSMHRINVGPESAGAEPGPACYGLGGKTATVTDADVWLGRVDPKYFAGGAVQLLPNKSCEVLASNIGELLDVDDIAAACMVVEVVNENMANAARVHTVERGKDMTGRVIIAFGGAAPLHGARMAEKLGLSRIVVPTGAGVGSAIGFLRAPISYEVVRSRFTRLNDFDLAGVNDMLADMHAEAEGVVRLGVPKGKLSQSRTADMRYVGQGHEISVLVPIRTLTPTDINLLQESFDESYSRQYGRTIPGVDVEILSWTVTVSHSTELPALAPEPKQSKTPPPSAWRRVFDGSSGGAVDFAVHLRAALKAGMKIKGPALIVEDATTTLVPSNFEADINSVGYIILNRHDTG